MNAQEPPRERARLTTVVVAAAIVTIVVVAALAIARYQATAPASAQASQTPTQLASLSPTNPAGTPTVRPSATPTALPSASRVQNGLGALRGNWIFVGKLVPSRGLPQAEVQIWGAPLEGGSPKLAFSYIVGTAGTPEGNFDNTPYLRRQFSPDGMRIVLSVEGQLVIVDLASGQSRGLGVAGKFPSWSKDGAQIAFLYEKPVQQVVPPEIALGVIPATGGVPREIAVASNPRQSAEWSPDGSMLLLSQANGAAVVDVASGRIVRRLSAVASGSASFAQWRATRPQIVLGSYGCDQGNAKIAALDSALAQERTLLDSGEPCASVNLRDPRWNPAIADEVLFVITHMTPGSEATGHTAHILDTGSGRDRDLGLAAYEATWTWDGGGVAYIAKAATAPYGNAVRLWSRNGSADRELLITTSGEYFFSIASVAY